MSDQDKKTRQTQWFAVTAFSVIALVAMTSNFNDNIGDETKETKWAVSAVSIAFTMSSLACIANLFLKDKFVDTTMETGMALLTAGFWTAGLPAIMNPDNNLAVDSYAGGVSNLNLYFFSWGAFLTSFMVFFSCLSNSLNTISGSSATETTESKEKRCTRSSWAVLLTLSFVVMVASARIYKDINCDSDLGVEEDSNFDAVCDRTKFGVSLGTISACIGLVWLLVTKFMLKGPMGSKLDAFLVWFLFVMWTFGVILLTFDKDKSPGRELGNLYFFTWGGWAWNVIMAMTSLQNLLSEPPEDTNDEGTMKEDHKVEPAVVNEPDTNV